LRWRVCVGVRQGVQFGADLRQFLAELLRLKRPHIRIVAVDGAHLIADRLQAQSLPVIALCSRMAGQRGENALQMHIRQPDRCGVGAGGLVHGARAAAYGRADASRRSGESMTPVAPRRRSWWHTASAVV